MKIVEKDNRENTSGNNFLKLYHKDNLNYYWIYCNNKNIVTIVHRLEDVEENVIFEKKIHFSELSENIQQLLINEINLYYNN